MVGHVDPENMHLEMSKVVSLPRGAQDSEQRVGFELRSERALLTDHHLVKVDFAVFSVV